MEKVEKKINGFLGAAMGSMLVMTVLGLVFVLAPGFMLSILHWGITVLLLAIGIAMIARDTQTGRMFSLFSTSLLGMVLVLAGIIIAIYPETLNIFTIAFGAYMILNSFMQLSVASRIKGSSAYTAALVTNLIGLVCGIIMIVRPGDSNEAIITIAGIVLMVYGISGLIDTFILKTKIAAVKDTVKEAKKEVKHLVDDIEEAEIVDEKKSKK
jgi:uncharacterized membrane protein HdeD (DUF308 family)